MFTDLRRRCENESDPHALPDEPGECEGLLAPIAASCLMKCLYGSRMARPDLLRPVAYLASCVTKWTLQNDRDMHQMFCYVASTLDYKTVSWCGDKMKDLQLKLFADADFAGCQRTQRSTSGVCMFLVGPNSRLY